MQSGGRFAFFDEEDALMRGCPDFNHQVVYNISREFVEQK